MKKTLLNSLLFSLISIMFINCSQKNYVVQELQEAPKWVMIPIVKGYVAEVGSASNNAGKDISFQREEAMQMREITWLNKLISK